jgi:hypothetical protein
MISVIFGYTLFVVCRCLFSAEGSHVIQLFWLILSMVDGLGFENSHQDFINLLYHSQKIAS